MKRSYPSSTQHRRCPPTWWHSWSPITSRATEPRTTSSSKFGRNRTPWNRRNTLWTWVCIWWRNWTTIWKSRIVTRLKKWTKCRWKISRQAQWKIGVSLLTGNSLWSQSIALFLSNYYYYTIVVFFLPFFFFLILNRETLFWLTFKYSFWLDSF